jgi:hypothetical protein
MHLQCQRQDLLGIAIQVHTKGTDAMSWLVVFISSFVPTVLLFMLLIMVVARGAQVECDSLKLNRRRTP